MKTPIGLWAAIVVTPIAFVGLLWERNWLAAAGVAAAFTVAFVVARRNRPPTS